MLSEPPVSSLRISNGDLPTRQAYRVQPSDQMSTLVSMTVPVLTSNSSGARYGIVLCSAAVSCVAMACDRLVMGSGDAAMEPRSMMMGSVPESEIMMFAGRVLVVSMPVFRSAVRIGRRGNKERKKERKKENHPPGLISRCA